VALTLSGLAAWRMKMSPLVVVAFSVVTLVSIGCPKAPMPVPAFSVTVPPLITPPTSSAIAPAAVMLLTALRAPRWTSPAVVVKVTTGAPVSDSTCVAASNKSWPPVKLIVTPPSFVLAATALGMPVLST
jgi:hypothetical protein